MKIFKPTYLYIKQHSITGKLYFGKTNKEDPIKYTGSGEYWNDHLKVHGKEHIETLWYCLFNDVESIKEFALSCSEQWDIVKLKDEFGNKIWANLKPENGTEGGGRYGPKSQIELLKLKGRTKETHKYIADVAALLSSRNKYNHPGIASQSAKLTGRTKETHTGIASQSNKMTGRTKETHIGVASQAIQITGRTKDTHDYLKSMSIKKRKISIEQDQLIYDLHRSGKTYIEIKEILQLDVKYDTLVKANARVKRIKEIETIAMEQE